MRYTKVTRYALLLTVATLAPIFSVSLLPEAHAATQYYLNPVPVFAQEGSSIVLVLTVVGALPSITYQFVFLVRDPSGKNWTSSVVTENTTASETSFSKLITYPSPNFIGSNSLCCIYNAQVNQIKPLPMTNAASTPFYIILTDAVEYERTQTVNIRATGYNASEPVTTTIRTRTTSTLVFTQTLPASSTGIVSAAWKVPKNATIDNYVLTLTGPTTKKSAPDAQGFGVKAAVMSISTLTSLKATYQRTETMTFSFQPAYPDGSIANTGVALLTLARPSGGNVTLTANYDSGTQTFNANYRTFVNNQTGTWTATLAINAYGDGYGNTGPGAKLTNSPQLTPALLNINVNATTYVAIGQQFRLNATITYPDGTALQSGPGVGAYLLFTGSPAVNRTVPVVFDSGLKVWVGSYNRQASDPGGLWSLVFKASDSPTPPNTGSATKAVTLQDRSPVASFTFSPLSAPSGSPISFDGTTSYDPDGTVTSYAWTFGDGSTGSGSLVNHAYSTAGTYTVTLTVTDNGGLTGSTSSQVTITDRPPIVSFTPSPSIANTGQTITLSITSSDPDGTISTTTINWGDGTVHTLTGSGSSDSHSYSSTGSATSILFTITITATDNSGSSTSTSSTVTVTDRPPTVNPTPSLTSASTGQTVTLSMTSADPDGTVSATRIDWGDGTVHTFTGAATSDTHNFTSTGSATSMIFTITITVTDNSGSTTSSSSPVTVSDRPPVISFSVSPTSPTTGQTVTVSVTSSDPDGSITATKVDWGDGTVDTLAGAPGSDTHTYTSTGSANSKTYAITITLTDNSGSATSSTSALTVQAGPQSTGNVSFPLYYFGIIAAILAALLAGGFLAFRRHRVTHAKLKIDLEAVRSEAGRIENQEFFQSVKDQLKKDKDD